MAYCNYEYYKSEFMGNVIAEADFPRLAERASRKLDMMTFDRLVNGIPTEYEKKVKDAICAISEQILSAEISAESIRNSGGDNVASVSSGSESISFKGSTANLYEQNKTYYAIAQEYLSNTGLLYAGM